MVKLTCKTVAGAAFPVDVPDAEAKISDVKALVATANPSLAGQTLVLIYQGKILADDVTLASTGYVESGFFVVMAKPAPKSTPAPPPAPAKPAGPPAADTPAAAAAAAPSEPTAAPAAAAAPPAAAPGAEGSAAPPAAAFEAGASALVTGAALEASVASICEMGFDRADVMRAMRAAFNNPERAVEYLMSGIPEGLGGGGGGGGEGGEAAAAAAPAPGSAGGAAPALAAPAAPAAAPAGPNAQPLDMFAPAPPPGAAPGGGGAGGPGAGGGGPLDFLRHHPQFRALRGVVQANPGVLQPMLAELGRQNPDLLALINAHQAEFLRLVNEPAGPEDAGEAAAALAAMQAMGGGGGGGAGGAGGLPPGAVQITLTPAEGEALGRLEALGFDRNACLEAYLACDKNEDLAANYLFEAGEDEEEEQGGGGGGGGGGGQ